MALPSHMGALATVIRGESLQGTIRLPRTPEEYDTLDESQRAASCSIAPRQDWFLHTVKPSHCLFFSCGILRV